MARGNSRFKDVYNRTLEQIHELPRGSELPSETALSEHLSASRTTIRAVLKRLSDEKIVDWHGRRKRILRRPRKPDYFVPEETRSASQIVESAFMQWIVNSDVPVGSNLNESELARRFNVSTSAVREFLLRFSRFGLIEKRPPAGWILNGFTKNFALELSDVRELFERRSVGIFVRQPDDAECWRDLDRIEAEHLDLLERLETDYLDISRLDEDFHRLLNSVAHNRFVSDFHDVISMIFHYHYRWENEGKRARAAVAINEHVDLIAALKSRDEAKALEASAVHLATARKTLLSSIEWR